MSGSSIAAPSGRSGYRGSRVVAASPTVGSKARRGSSGKAGPSRLDRLVGGVPARYMAPRIILIVCTFALVAFGLLMIYSASSVTALTSEGDAAYYVKRQLGPLAIGLAGAIAVAFVDYHVLVGRWLPIIWGISVLALVITALMGMASHGATRWISIGSLTIQPSEFAKITVVLTAANLCARYFEEQGISFWRFVGLMAVGVLTPLALIIMQPDKGTTMVTALTVFVMLFMAGFPPKILWLVFAGAAVGFLAYSLKDEYSRERFVTMLDPWADPYGDGYQLLQGFYAFGSGGLFGVGIGMSRQKYSYLPEAHNDFIFAIIGEECGLVGTLGVIAGFIVFIWAGLEICRNAPDLAGKLICAGCTSLIGIQALLNILGVLGLFPLSGKTLPFISYGGTSIMTCVLLVGLVVSVSRRSALPETVHERRRESLDVVRDKDRVIRDGGYPGPGMGDVGPVMTRSEAARTPSASPLGQSATRTPPRPGTSSRRGLTLVEGGRGRDSSASQGRVRGPGERAGSAGDRDRINLGDSAADRLRPESGPSVRGRGSRSSHGNDRRS